MAPARPSADGARPRNPAKKIVENIREATGASDEDIKAVLAECNNDVNEATTRLIDNPFSKVVSKKDRRKEKEEQAKKERAAESKKNHFSGPKGGKGGNKGASGGRGRSGAGRKENGQPAKNGPKQEQAQKGAAPAAQAAAEPKEAPPASALPPRSGRTMADLFKKPAPQQQPPERQRGSQQPKEKPAATAAPETTAIPETTEKQVSNNQTSAETEAQQAAASAWGKPVASGQQGAVPAPRQPAAPQTGLATSLMSALGAGNPPKNQASGLQHPNATQSRLPENEQRGQPGSTSTGNDVGLNLQFGNFGLGTGNDFGSGFGSTFETQAGTAAQAGQQPQASPATAQEPKQSAFSSFQENQSSSASQGAPKQQMDAQQMQHQTAHQYGYSGYAGAGGYWPASGRQQPQPQPQQALAQQQPQQPQPPKSGKVDNTQGQQAHAAATMMPYGAPAIGGMGQYTQFGFPQYAYQYAQYPAGYYPPQYYPAPQGSQYPPQPGSSGQAPRVPSGGANTFGLYGEEQAVNYQQAPAPGGNYPGQAPAYNYGQYGR